MVKTKRARPYPKLRMKDLREGLKLKPIMRTMYFGPREKPIVQRDGASWFLHMKKHNSDYWLCYLNVGRFTFAEGPW